MPFVDKSTLTYPATNSFPIRKWLDTRDPTSSDYKSFQLFDIWINEANNTAWINVGRTSTNATWIQMASSGTGILTITGDSGGAVGPDGNDNIFLQNGNNTTVVGTALSNELAIDVDGNVADSFLTDDAMSAVPSSGVLEIAGAGGITTSSSGNTVTITAGGTVGTFYTTDAGTATPSLNTLNVFGGTAIDTAGAGATVTINATTASTVETGQLSITNKVVTPGGLEPILITPYVVAPGGAYTTIQSALDAANAAGGGTIWIRPGTYTEDLTLYDNTTLCGSISQVDAGFLKIIGTHTPPATGTTGFFNIWLEDASAIISSAAAGSATIHMFSVITSVTNGYTFDLPNWTGFINIFDFFALGTDDGFFNNTGGASTTWLNVGCGNGTVNPMILSGTCIFIFTQFFCPVEFRTGANFSVDNHQFFNTVSCLNNSTGTITQARFSTDASEALIMGSSGSVNLYDCVIDSSNNPAIGGTGAGTLTLADVTFVNDTNISGTVTLGYAGATEVADLYAQNISFDRGTSTVDTDGQLIIGSTGANPQISTLTAGAGISIANGAGSITISSSSQAVIQVVESTNNTSFAQTGTIPHDDTIPQQGEGQEILTAAIAPTNAANLLRIEAYVNVGYNTPSGINILGCTMALFQDATLDALAVSHVRRPGTSGVEATVLPLVFYMTAGTESATTFKIRIGDNNANHAWINGENGARFYGGTLISRLVITEFAV